MSDLEQCERCGGTGVIDTYPGGCECCVDPEEIKCSICDGSGFRTIHGGGSGDPEWDADDQPCSECNDNYSRVPDPTLSKP